MNANQEVIETLKRALAELEAPTPPVEVGEDGWRRVYEYARRSGFATASIRDCLQLLGERPTNV